MAEDSSRGRKKKTEKTPTDVWLEQSPVPPLTGPDNVAERLLLLVHYGMNWDVWGTPSRRVRYWDALTERVKASTFAGPKLEYWWANMSTLMDTNPRNNAEREELASLLGGGSDKEVLSLFRNAAPVIVLRVRLVAESRRDGTDTDTDTDTDGDVQRTK